MKSTSSRIALIAVSAFAVSAAFAQTGSRKPIVLPMPVIPNGSNYARAPFPSQRPFNDMKRPDGAAINKDLPPNTPATDPEPNALPAPRVALGNARPLFEPGLSPTGRVSVSLSGMLDASRVGPQIRGADFGTRDQTVAQVENHLTAIEPSVRSIRGTTSEMSASGREQFSSLNAELKQREHALRKTIREARYSSPENWSEARDHLAADYDAYAQVAAQVDTATGAVPAR